jgi:signal transduction histidine kinase
MLLDRVGSFVDLALQRCRLFDQEARSRRAAEAANAELQTLVYSVSHDLRNPIISVLGYLDVLAEEHAGQLQGEGEHYLHRISVNALYMQSLIQDLLELSRIGRSEPAPETVDVGVLADSVAQEVRVAHPGCDVVVAGDFPVVWMSPLRARQLLTNLVDNAAKHSPEGAVVTVSARELDDGDALVTVADDGRGIPVEYREKAFEVFERLDAAHGDVPGTGMGLPICRRIVESVGGTISLDGPSEGHVSGTTVKVVMPRTVLRSWSPLPTPEQENVS